MFSLSGAEAVCARQRKNINLWLKSEDDEESKSWSETGWARV